MGFNKALFAALAGAMMFGGCGTDTGGGEFSRDTAVGQVGQELTDTEFSAELALVSDWPTGYTAQLTVTNRSDVPTTTWQIELDLNDSEILPDPWNGSFSGRSGVVTVSPVAFNAVIYPHSSITLGWNGTKTGADYQPRILSFGRDGATSPDGDGAAGAGGTGTEGSAGGNDPSSGGEALGGGLGTGGTVPVSNVCVDSTVQLISVGPDLDGIWRGTESPETGRDVLSDHRFFLEFDHPVDPDRVLSSVSVRGQVASLAEGRAPGACLPGREITRLHQPKLRRSVVGDAWTRSLVFGERTLSYPGEFNIFALESISGLPSIGGPIAAKGNIDLWSFSLNSGNSGLGLLSEGSVTLQNGSVGGDLVTAAPVVLPATIGITGSILVGAPIPFDEAWSGLRAMSAELRSLPAGGQVTVTTWGGIELLGSDPERNVFRVDAAVFAGVNSMRLSTPPNSIAVVDLVGRGEFSLQNAGITLDGAAPERILWNAPELTQVRLSGLSFLGSLLAPEAMVKLDNGDLQGTIVARKVEGTGAVQYRPFVGLSSVETRVLELDVDPLLFGGCEYVLTVDVGPLDQQGHCMAEQHQIPFRVATSTKPPHVREAVRAQWRRDGTAAFFRVREGVNLTLDEAIERYAAALGLGGEDSLVVLSSSAPSDLVPGAYLTRLAQLHDGKRVIGHGVSAHVLNGFVRRFRSNLVPVADAPESHLSAEDAVARVVSELALPPYPWELVPSAYSPPTAEMVYFSGGVEVPRLAWRVSLATSGLGPAAEAFVDAEDGSVTVNQQEFFFSCENFSRTQASLERQQSWDVQTRYNGLQQIWGSVWNDDDVQYHQLFANPNRATGSRGAVAVTIGQWQERVSAEELVRLTAKPVCDAEGTWEDDALQTDAVSALWGVQNAESLFAQFVFQGEPWLGISGNYGSPTSVTKGALRILLDTDGVPDVNDGPQLLRIEVDEGSSGGPRLGQTIYVNLARALDVYRHPVWPDALGHEFAHGVLMAARARHTGTEYSDLGTTGESAAIQEGFADIFGELAEIAVTGAEFSCMTPYCLRNFGDPGASTAFNSGGVVPSPKADTYGVAPAPGRAREQEMYVNSTVLSHWFYLLAHGGEGTNGLGCSYTVGGIDRFEAANILFAALSTGVDSYPTFAELKEVTLDVADEIYGLEQRLQVEAAWNAVGVGVSELPTDPIPMEGALVDPFDAELSWHAADDASWVVQVGKNGQWEGALWHVVQPVLSGDSFRVRLDLDLEPNSAYEWRALRYPGLSNEEYPVIEDWVGCTLGGTFRTGNARPVVVLPTRAEDGLYEFDDYEGTVVLGGLPGAESWVVGVDLPGDCNELRARVLDGRMDGIAWIAPESDGSAVVPLVGSLFQDDRDTDLGGGGKLPAIPGEPYRLSIMPLGSSDTPGDCTTIGVRWPVESAPTAVAPGNRICWGHYGDTAAFYYAGGAPVVFEWTPVTSATGYRLVYSIDNDLDEEEPWYLAEELSLADVTTCGELDRSEVPYRQDSNLCFVRSFPDVAHGLARWRVEAIVDEEEYWTSSRLCFWQGPTKPEIVWPQAFEHWVEDPDTGALLLETIEFELEFSCLYAGSILVDLVSTDGEVAISTLADGHSLAEGGLVLSLSVTEAGQGKEFLLTLTPSPWAVDEESRNLDDLYVLSETIAFSVVDNALDVDNDGDGFTELEEDCNDADGGDNGATVEDRVAEDQYPGLNINECWGIDHNCNGVLDELVPGDCNDDDGDGHYRYRDCDDQNPEVNTSAQEICGNGIDDDCNDFVDDDCVAECAQLNESGGDEGLLDGIQVDMGMGCGTSILYLNTYDIPDQVVVKQGYNVVFDSGCVSTGDTMLEGVVEFCGNTRMLTVFVYPWCAEFGVPGQQEPFGSTVWEFSLSCPEPATN